MGQKQESASGTPAISQAHYKSLSKEVKYTIAYNIKPAGLGKRKGSKKQETVTLIRR